MGNLTANTDSRTYYKIMEDTIMPAIVEFPTVVKEALQEFGPLFANEPERKHFAEYLTGLMRRINRKTKVINISNLQAVNEVGLQII